MSEAKDYPADRAGARLAGMPQDPNGLEFTVRFVDEVVRPEDHSAAAKKLRELAPLAPRFLGQEEADRRLAGTHQLLDRNDVDYVSIKVSSTVAPHSHWGFEEAVAHMEERLLGLYAKASAANPRKFINLDMEEYSDLDFTVAVFKKILSRPEFLNLEAGIVLQAYLPDALGVMMDLQAWTADRVTRGGAPIKVRVVKGANLPMETVEARIHGWPRATWSSKQESDTSYKAVLDYALTPSAPPTSRSGSPATTSSISRWHGCLPRPEASNRTWTLRCS